MGIVTTVPRPTLLGRTGDLPLVELRTTVVYIVERGPSLP